MPTLYAYWDTVNNQLASAYTIGQTRKSCGEKLIDLLGEEQAYKLVFEGKLVITEIQINPLDIKL